MEISRICDMDQFNKLKAAWDAAYSADAQTQIFVSWAWLRGWFEATPNNWFVLAIRPDSWSHYVAFFPLAMHSRQLFMGGNPLADYAGFVCSPKYEEEAIAAFAAYIQQELKWDSFHMNDVLDARLQVFLKRFSSKKFNVQQAGITPCPHIRLPRNWDQYLQDFLGRKTRRDLRRSLRKIEGSSEYRLTHVGADNLESQIETLLAHWHSRWRLPEYFQNGYRKIFRRCFEDNYLWLSILWDGTTPIGALAGFLDRQKETFTACITTCDAKYTQLRAGKAIYAYSIQYAIENGYTIYDFTRGKEDYKYSFGARDRFNTNVVIVRRDPISAAKRAARRLRRSLLKRVYCNR